MPLASREENCCTAPLYFGYTYAQILSTAWLKSLLLLLQPMVFLNNQEWQKSFETEDAFAPFLD
jgi:hypothetical protein